jgi:hypothetical protein
MSFIPLFPLPSCLPSFRHSQNELSVDAHRPLIINSLDNTLTCEDFTDKMTTRALPQHAVLRGKFACCAMNHTIGGTTIPCDKVLIAPVLDRVYKRKLDHLKEIDDLVNFAWFQCLRPSILAEAVLSAETMPEFLTRYGWSAHDPEGSDAPKQNVFFPLFCAATEGNAAITRALLEAGADSKRRLLGIGTSSLEAAALCGHAEVCKALLDAGAEVNGCSQFDGSTPLIKAVKGGDCVVVKLLLCRGADRSGPNHAGETPLSIAAIAQNEDMCVALREAAEKEGPFPVQGKVDSHAKLQAGEDTLKKP